MACTKHIQRKRPNTCPECAAELNKSQEPIAVLTSRDMLVEMEKEEEGLVIKKERKKRAPKEEPTPEPVVENIEAGGYDEIVVDVVQLNQELIKAYFDNQLRQFKAQIAALSKIQWEHLQIPLKEFRSEMTKDLEKDGWRYKDMWIGDIARISGCKEDVAVFERVKNPEWPPAPTFGEKKKNENKK